MFCTWILHLLTIAKKKKRHQFLSVHFTFPSTTTVCEFAVQIKNKQAEKCNCAFSAYFQCAMNTNISLPSNSVKNWSLKTLSVLVVHLLRSILHSCLLPLNWISAHREGKNGGVGRKSVKAIKLWSIYT